MLRSLFILLLFAIFQTAIAQKKRALLVGINNYIPIEKSGISDLFQKRNIQNLEGPVNDVNAIQSIISTKYDFAEKDIIVLINDTATRAIILNSLENLLQTSQPGDIVFFFYAGHGSQVFNSLSTEKDKMDESIVPADAWKPGIKDIRDKEFSAIFSKLIDKNIKLTVVFDCCYSGSLERGPGMRKTLKRFAYHSNEDAKDPSKPSSPEKKANADFLFLAASQDNEQAEELNNDFGQPMGVFTNALINALNQAPVSTAPEQVFTSLRSIIKSNGCRQEPVLRQSVDRKNRNFFSISTASLPQKTMVAVSGIIHENVILQGGYALGIYPQTELQYIKGKDSLILIVDTVLGLNKAIAKVKTGSTTLIKPGEFCYVVNWVKSSAPLLKLYIPASKYDANDLAGFVKIIVQVGGRAGIKFTNDITRSEPEGSIYFQNDGFYLNRDDGQFPLFDMRIKALEDAVRNKRNIYVEFPPAQSLTTALTAYFEKNKSIMLVKTPEDANYVVYGTIDEDGHIAYGLRASQVNPADSIGLMPLRTDSWSPEHFPESLVADHIYNAALKLSKLRGWVHLSPPIKAVNRNAFHIELMDLRTKKIIAHNIYMLKDSVSFNLVMNKDYNEYPLLPAFLYVFSIDREGTMQLLFPEVGNGNNEDNRFPFYKQNKIDERKELFQYTVEEPVGTDQFFVLMTDQPILSPEYIFNQEGITSRNYKGANQNALLDLLNMGNEGYKSRSIITPENWALVKLLIKTIH